MLSSSVLFFFKLGEGGEGGEDKKLQKKINRRVKNKNFWFSALLPLLSGYCRDFPKLSIYKLYILLYEVVHRS
jgi:hypothetical protein